MVANGCGILLEEYHHYNQTVLYNVKTQNEVPEEGKGGVSTF